MTGNAKGDLAALSTTTLERLDELKKALVGALGDDLVALVVYGSAARGGYKEGTSDVDLAVVLKSAPREKLEKISNVMQLARYSARIESILLVADEIPRAADVFPLLYDDIQKCHVVLHGTSPFTGLEIADRHRRLRIEQELREAQIRLRRAVVDGLGASNALAGAVLRKAKQVRGPLHALLALKGIVCDDDLATVLAKAAETYGVDAAAVRKAKEDPSKAHDALVALLAKATADVDAMEDK